MFFIKNNYFLYICNFFIIYGIFIGFNRIRWLIIWVRIEITLIFFIPCLILNKRILERFSSLKYFIFQCLGSIFFILGSIDFFYLNTFGLFLKLGLFPNHFWIFIVSKRLSWKNFFFIITVQKFLPLIFLVISLDYMLLIFIVLIFINSFVGNLGRLNQMDLRFLIVFSSINHISWIIISSILNLFYFLYYFIFYIILNIYLFQTLKVNNILFFYQIFLKKNYNFNIFLILTFLMFFSFLGFPPLVGFFIKLISIFSFLIIFLSLILFFLLIQNLIISYSYIRVIIFFYINLSRSIKLNKFYLKNLKIFTRFVYIFFLFLI